MDIVKDDVVISGIGGYFPKAHNIEEFKNRLFENEVLVSPAWTEDKTVPNACGKIESDLFDNSYFGIHRQQCFYMDPMHRLALERCFEALIDAGVNPMEIRGKRVGVYMGSTIGENDQLFTESVVSGFGVTGHARAMLANRISYWLNLKGPSVAYDANWVSGVEVLRLGYEAIKTGQCESVIIGCSNVVEYVEFQSMYNELGVLSQDGSVKAFDADANGYARAEGTVMIYLQKASEARRVYASVVNVAAKFDGRTKGDFMDIDKDCLVEFLSEFYKNSKVKPEEVDFVEAYGCANKKVDKAELDSFDEIYCKNRSKPLMVGSVKTVTGHSEPASVLFSLVKAIIALETDVIPATLQYTTPNPEIKSLIEGRIEVVTTNKKWNSKYIAVNALGSSAYFGHILLEANPKKKKPMSLNLPLLLTASTRTEEGINKIIETLKNKPKDPEYSSLVHDFFSKSIQGHLYRGYILMGQDEPKVETINHLGNKRQIWFVYSGMGSQWNEMLGDLMQIPIFADSINRSAAILAKKGVDLMTILSSKDKTLFDNILHSFVSIAAMQIALTDVLHALGIVPDGIIGHSVGELGCAYADGCMTAEEMIMSSYSRGRASLEASLVPGMMAAVGLGYNQIKDKLPPTIEVACRNGPESCTISGPTEDMEVYVKSLQDKGTFAKLVNVANIAYHSRYIKPAAPLLLKYLKEVLPKPILRSSKWVSTSNVEADWDTDLAKHSSAEYHTNNLLNSVLFEEGIKHIPKDSVLIEIAPHGLLQAILKRSVKDSFNIPLTHRGTKSGTEFLLQSLGKLYLAGVDMKLANIYPKIEYPVSKNTPSLSDLVHWNHAESWSRAHDTQKLVIGVRNLDVNIFSEGFENCTDHKLNGQYLLPVTKILEILLQLTENPFEANAIVFENILFKNNIIIPDVGDISLSAMRQPGTGEFEIFLKNDLLISGKLTLIDSNENTEIENIQIPVNQQSLQIDAANIYEEFEHRGYQYGSNFKVIKNLILSKNGSVATLERKNKWSDLVETMIQQHLFFVSERNQNVYVPQRIQKLTIVNSLLPQEGISTVNVHYEYSTNTIVAPGIKINNFSTVPFDKHKLDIQLDSVVELPLQDNIVENIEIALEQCVRITLANYKDPSIAKCFISEIETANPLQDKIKTVTDTFLSFNIFSTLVKTTKQLILAEYPTLLVVNDVINDDLVKLLLNSETAILLAKKNPKQEQIPQITILYTFRCGRDHYILCKRALEQKPHIITIKESSISIKNLENKSISWVAELFKNISENHVMLETSLVPAEGLDNFIQAIRNIPKLNKVRIFYNLDKNSQKIEEAARRDFTSIILKDGIWYTYLPLNLNTNRIVKNKSTQIPVIESRSISYISLNLKDETLTPEIQDKNEVGNIDYSGHTQKGERIMGLAYLDKETSKFVFDDILTFQVPEAWTLKEATSVPHAFISAYYMLFVKARLKYGETVLIHAGCSPIGLAAINICRKYGCQIFTTVSSNQQKAYLVKSNLIIQRNILDLNSSSIDSQLLFATGGKGAEVILNCSSGITLKDSFACTAVYGRFIHYGKYDAEQGNSIGMYRFLKNVDLYFVDLQNIFEKDKEVRETIRKLVQDGIEKFVVRPMFNELIKFEDIGSIMKKLASPDIIGKLIINVKSDININQINVKEPYRFACYSKYTYVISGGSALNWINFAEWLVQRGARKIIINSENSPSNNHLNRRLSILERYYDANIITSNSRVQTKENVEQFLSEVQNLGPLHAVFILPSSNRDSEVVEIIDDILRKLAPKALLVNFIKAATGACYRRSLSEYATSNIQIEQQELKNVMLLLDNILYSNSNNVVVKKQLTQELLQYSSTAVIDISKLIPSSDDVTRLQKNAPNEPEFMQVLTEGPVQIRELAPLFIIPGLAGFKELEEFVQHLLYPTFCAVLPNTPWSFEKLAEVYAQKMCEIYPSGPYNIVSISSGGPLTIEIAKQLAKKTTNLHLFFIDSTPRRIQQGLKDLGENSLEIEMSILKTLFELNDLKFTNELKQLPNFEARLALLTQRTNKSERVKRLLEDGLVVVRDYIEQVKQYKPSGELVAGKIHHIYPDDCIAFDSYGLHLFFKNMPVSTQIVGNHLSIIRHKNTYEYINEKHYQ